MNKSKIVGAIVIGTLILFFALCFRIVGVGEVGIVTTFGNVTGESGSGVLIKAPWPIQSLTKMNVQIQKEQQDATAATHDLQSVTTTIALNYNLTPATAGTVYKNIGVDYKERIIDPVLQEAVKATTSEYDAADLIAKRPEVESKVFEYIQKSLSSRGITVDNISIVNFAFSDTYAKAVESKTAAQQQAQQAQYDLQRAQLEAQAQQVQATTLTPDYLELQAIQKWDGHLPSTVSGGNGTILSIPLGK